MKRHSIKRKVKVIWRLLLLGAILVLPVASVRADTAFTLSYPEQPRASHEFNYINDSEETADFLQYSKVASLKVDLEDDFWNNVDLSSLTCHVQYADAGNHLNATAATFAGCSGNNASYAGGTTVTFNRAAHRIEMTFGTGTYDNRPFISGRNTSYDPATASEGNRKLWVGIGLTTNNRNETSWTATSRGTVTLRNLKYNKHTSAWSAIDDNHPFVIGTVETTWRRYLPPPNPRVSIEKSVRNITRDGLAAPFVNETQARDGDTVEYRIRVTDSRETPAAVNITDNLLCSFGGQRTGDNGGAVTRELGLFASSRISTCTDNHDVTQTAPFVFTYRATVSDSGIPRGQTSTVINTAEIENAQPPTTEIARGSDDARVIIETTPSGPTCESLTVTPTNIVENTAADIAVTVAPGTFAGSLQYETASGGTFTANAPVGTGNPLLTTDRTVRYSGGTPGTIIITTEGAGASPACRATIPITTVPPGPRCGDNIVNQPSEQCDDGNNVSGDGCSATCQPEPAPRCGDGIVNQPSEQCDDGNTIDTDACSNTCQRNPTTGPRCGDGIVNQPSEQCDDGNNVSGDGCSATCTLEGGPGGGGPRCGNGLLEAGEQCDDGNNLSGDGCSSSCQLEGGPGGGGPGGGGPGGGGPGGGGPPSNETINVGPGGGGGPGAGGGINFPGLIGFPGLTIDQLTKGARFLENNRNAIAPTHTQTLAEFTITYTAAPDGARDVTITDTVSGTGKIPGSRGDITFTPVGHTVTLPKCTQDITANCYTGRIDDAQGILLKRLAPGTQVTIRYRGNVHSQVTCEENAPTNCLGEKFENTAHAVSDLGTREASARLFVLCPYLLTRNAGDVLFEQALSVGTDVSCINPAVKNTEGLAMRPAVLRERPSFLTPTGPGEIPTELIEAYETARREPAETPTGLSLCDPERRDVNGVIPRFSSFICEIATKLESFWQRPTIETRLTEQKIRLSRYNETLNDTTGVRDITDLNTLPEGPNPRLRVFHRTGDLRLTPIAPFRSGAQTIIVENGNLLIDHDITYATDAPVEFKKAPTLAFIVLHGDIVIAPDVRRIDGVLFVKDGKIRSASDEVSNEQLEIHGAVYGDIEPLAQKRNYVGDPVEDGGAIVIRYDARLLLNPPPGLDAFVKLDHEKVAR